MSVTLIDILAEIERNSPGSTAMFNPLTPAPAAMLPESTPLPQGWSPPLDTPSLRGLFIPLHGPAVECRLPRDTAQWIECVKRHIGGTIERVLVGGGHTMLVNGDGLLLGLPRNRNLKGLLKLPIVGSVVISGEQDDISPGLTPATWRQVLFRSHQVEVVAVPVDSSHGKSTRVTISSKSDLKCLLCPTAEIHTERCPRCPDTMGLMLIGPGKDLRDGEAATALIQHPRLSYPDLLDNVNFAGLFSLFGRVIVVQLRKQGKDWELATEGLPSGIGTCNPALDVIRSWRREAGLDIKMKRTAAGQLVQAVPYNPLVPETEEDDESRAWWSLTGERLPEQE